MFLMSPIYSVLITDRLRPHGGYGCQLAIDLYIKGTELDVIAGNLGQPGVSSDSYNRDWWPCLLNALPDFISDQFSIFGILYPSLQAK
jgi:hypothetical protein